MRWLIDGYNVIRRSPELSSREKESLEAGRQALCHVLAWAAHATGDRFTVVFDGARGGGRAIVGGGVQVIFSSARETADRLLGRLAAAGGTVVSNDREVRRAATRAGAIAVSTDEFLARVPDLGAARTPSRGAEGPRKDEDDDVPPGPRKGNARRLPKKARAAARALGRLRPRPS